MSIVLNDLYDYDGMKIYQNNDNFKFSLDSILLAEFVDLKKESVSSIVRAKVNGLGTHCLYTHIFI